jgi:hypothetical protein
LGADKAREETFDGSWSPVTPPDCEPVIMSKEEIKKRVEEELVCMYV